jgi:hypothetical protein
MLPFILVAALLLMMLPAFLSVLFASARPLMIVWNFSWYALMGYMAAIAFQSASGFLVGFFFALFYTLRLLMIPRHMRGGPFSFARMKMQMGSKQRTEHGYSNRTNSNQAAQQNYKPRSVDESPADVIEAEYTKEN